MNTKHIKNSLLHLFLLCLLFGCSDNVKLPSEEKEEEPVVNFDFVVAKDGSGDFPSVQQAFDAVVDYNNERTVIYIKNGVYEEVLELSKTKKNVTIIGESVDGVRLTYNNYASKINPESGKEYGTSGSSSNYIRGEGFYALNVTFENTAGPVGQALAIYIAGDKAVFVNCRFLGNQDTMYGGRCRQYFKDCYIEGSTDFIFGPSTAFFDDCELFTKGGSAITAASTESYVDFGYVFNNCAISGTGKHITTLGRPWRPYAAVSFLNCQMSACIKPEGWDNWGNADNETTARYVEYKSSGPGAQSDQRVDWLRQLTNAEAAKYTFANVLKTTYAENPVTDNWDPTEVIGQTTEFLGKVNNK